MSERQLARAVPGTSEAARCRREAAEIRDVVPLIRDEKFREQLLAIAHQYELIATAIENEPRIGQDLDPPTS